MRAPAYVSISTRASVAIASLPESTTCTWCGVSCSGSHRSNSTRQLYLTLDGQMTSTGHSRACASSAMAVTVLPSPMSSATRPRMLFATRNSTATRWCGSRPASS
eukprot:scaffold125133_cov48-Phaeocystis_antarctica.AAC.2